MCAGRNYQAHPLSHSLPRTGGHGRDPGNTLTDFSADSFQILTSCGACGHEAAVERENVPEGVDGTATAPAAAEPRLRSQGGIDSGRAQETRFLPSFSLQYKPPQMLPAG